MYLYKRKNARSLGVIAPESFSINSWNSWRMHPICYRYLSLTVPHPMPSLTIWNAAFIFQIPKSPSTVATQDHLIENRGFEVVKTWTYSFGSGSVSILIAFSQCYCTLGNVSISKCDLDLACLQKVPGPYA